MIFWVLNPLLAPPKQHLFKVLAINMVETFKACFPPLSNGASVDRLIKWNNSNHYMAILNVDGSCLGSPARLGFTLVLRNNAGFCLLGFSGYINNFSDILQIELLVIYHGLLLAKAMDIDELVCHFDFLHCINLVKCSSMKFHDYVVLIDDIKDLIEQNNITIFHTLREWNQYANFMAKFEALSNIDLIYTSPTDDLLISFCNKKVLTNTFLANDHCCLF